MSEWIQTENQVPPCNTDLLVFHPERGISTGEYDENQEWEYDWFADNVIPTHWMLLPLPPVMEGDK